MTPRARPARRHPALLTGVARAVVALVALALVVLQLTLGAAPASAHAELLETDPAEGAVVDDSARPP